LHGLEVGPRTFGVRRLRVPEKFVTPPPGELARIERERKQMAEILSKVSESRLWRGAFEKPVDGVAVSNFGVRSDYNGQKGTPHRGTDFAGSIGTPVRAPGGGRVVLTADLYYSGNTVVVDHGLGVYSLLAHLSRIDVHEDEPVARGTIVGAVGATGRVTGPHLHWSVRIGQASVDPLSLIAVTASEKGSDRFSTYWVKPSN
jgi:murein DD-endopeptidase MepM/ murein hydrolase activator NlpD